MKIKYNSEIISGGLFGIVAAILWLLIPSQIQTLEKSVINAQTVPSIAIGGLFIFSIGLLLQGIVSMPKKEIYISAESFKTESFKKELKSVIFALILLIYAVLISFVGFIISTSALVISILLFYSAKKWYYYAITLGTVFLAYYVFAKVLYVSLPSKGGYKWKTS